MQATKYFLSVLFFIWCSHTITIEHKPIIFLVYIAADNNLYPYVDLDLQEMMKIGTNDNIAILAYVNTCLNGNQKVSRRLIVYNDHIIQDGPDFIMDSGKPETLFDACAWAHERFSSDYFVLVLWDHGSGSLNRLLRKTIDYQNSLARIVSVKNERAVCYDDSTGSYLTDYQLRDALRSVCYYFRNGKKIDIVAFDACLMSDVEIAYALAPYVSYMVASQETIPGVGFGYDRVLQQATKRVLKPREFAIEMVNAYYKTYWQDTGEFTLSALDLNALDPLVQNINEVAMALAQLLNSEKKEAVKKVITRCIKNCITFNHGKYIDLYQWYDNLCRNLDQIDFKDSNEKITLEESLMIGLSLINQCVVANAYGTDFILPGGLSIYFDRKTIDNTYLSVLWASETKWLNLLYNFLQV